MNFIIRKKSILMLLLCCGCLGYAERRLPFTPHLLYDLKPSAAQEHSILSNPYYEGPSKPYKFNYGVQDAYSGANFIHSQNSDGNAVKGSYAVALPDGRIQRVNYVADGKNGFQAEVTYEGEAAYPDPPTESHSKNLIPSHVQQNHNPQYFGHTHFK